MNETRTAAAAGHQGEGGREFARRNASLPSPETCEESGGGQRSECMTGRLDTYIYIFAVCLPFFLSLTYGPSKTKKKKMAEYNIAQRGDSSLLTLSEKPQ